MLKLVGYVEMKKTTGKVLFVVDEEKKEHIVGYATDKLFFYGENSRKINASHIGKNLDCRWERGYNDRVNLADVDIK